MTDFDSALAQFLTHVARMVEAPYAVGSIAPDVLEHTVGRRYVRVFKDPHGSPSGRSVYCFVDRKDGTVLKPAGWKGPAKGSWGSVYDPSSWARMSRYGVGYLR